MGLKSLNGHHKVGETWRQELTNKIEQLSKVILDRKSGVVGERTNYGRREIGS